MSNRAKAVDPEKIADQIRKLYKKQGLPPEAAFTAIGDLYRGLGGEQGSPGPSGLVTMSEVDYPPIPKDAPMAKAEPARKKPKSHANGKADPRVNGRTGLRFTRFTLPAGPGWAARVARGLVRWREKHKLTVPVAAKQYQVDLTAWYRVERGTHVSTTALHIDNICQAIRLDIVDLLTLGK